MLNNGYLFLSENVDSVKKNLTLDKRLGWFNQILLSEL